jgi:MFS family permease
MHPYVSLFLFTLIDVLGFSIVLPLFPFLATNFDMSPVEVGLLQSSNAFAQLVATPIIGALSDKYVASIMKYLIGLSLFHFYFPNFYSFFNIAPFLVLIL